MKHGKKRQLRVWVLLVLDFFGVCGVLLVFALFHHVIPRRGGEPVTVPYTEPITGSVETDEPRQDVTDAPETTSTDQPSALSGFAAKWPERFSATPVEDEQRDADGSLSHYTYSDSHVSLTLDRCTAGKAVYFFADIYVDSVERFRTAFASDEFGSGRKESTAAVCERLNALIAVNGDYYGNSAARKGIVIRNGLFYREHKENFDVCVLYRDGTMKTYSASAFNAAKSAQNGAWQAWSFGPSLLHGDGSPLTNAEIVSEVKPANPRTAVGYFEPGHYCFVVVDGRQDGYSSGMRLEEMGAMMSAHGCKVAYNFDGGATSVMALKGAVVNRPYSGGRGCSDFIYIGEAE